MKQTMKWRWTQLAFLTVALASPAGALAVVEDVSEIYVSTAVKISGAPAGGANYTFYSPQFVNPAVAAGTVGSVSGTTLTDPNASWSDGQFAGGYYVEFPCGTYVDLVSCSAAGKSITLAGSPPAAVGPGTRYSVRRHTTISDIFGAHNEAGLLAGLNPSTADTVMLYSASIQSYLTAFYVNAPGFEGWYSPSFVRMENQVVPPGCGLVVKRRAVGDAIAQASGVVKEGPTRLLIKRGYNLVGTLKSSLPTKLRDLNLVTGDAASGLTPGVNPAQADTLMCWGVSGAFASYFYVNVPGFEGWYTPSFVRSDDQPIAPGTAFYIQRKNLGSDFWWTIPSI
jgi:hypothetical protein